MEDVKESPQEHTGRTHYLAHHAVIRRDKRTTKVRIVFDASARSNGPSLNDCLYVGPKFDQKIFDILLRFRTHKIGLIADIEKAFLMVAMKRDDRDVLRFLWTDDLKAERPQPVEHRFTRVVFGVASSPFLLNATIRFHLENSAADSDLISKLIKAFYVDDIITGAEDEAKAYRLYCNSKRIMMSGGFNLRKFLTNSSLVQMQIDAEEAMGRDIHAHLMGFDETYNRTTLGVSQGVTIGETKVLGILWNPTSDHLILNLCDVATEAPSLQPTKR